MWYQITISKGGTIIDTVPVEADSALAAIDQLDAVHEKFTVQDIEDVRAQFPEVVILSHPECSPEVVAASDYSGSTTAMVRYVEETNAPRYLVLTECAMGDNIAAANPDKEMLRLCRVRCPHMNEITLEMTLEALKNNRQVIEVPEKIRVQAAQAVEWMIAIG